jgi:hypothetical protein
MFLLGFENELLDLRKKEQRGISHVEALQTVRFII